MIQTTEFVLYGGANSHPKRLCSHCAHCGVNENVRFRYEVCELNQIIIDAEWSGPFLHDETGRLYEDPRAKIIIVCDGFNNKG